MVAHDEVTTDTEVALPAASGASTWWDRSWARFDRWTPYVLLAGSTVLSLLPSDQPPGGRSLTVLLAALAVAWLMIGNSAASVTRRSRPGFALVHLAVLLGLAALLMARDLLFFAFAISGFLHAARLRPLPLVFVGTGATSALILYFTWGGIPSSTGDLVVVGLILVIQTFLIGFGVAGGERLAELSEERRATLAALEASVAANEALQAQLLQRARDAGVSEERQRLAREIHDTIAQGLTGVITQLEAARQREDDVELRRRHLDDAATLARESLAEARRSVHALTPVALEAGALPSALHHEVRRWSDLHQLAAETLVSGADAPLPSDVEVTLLRAAQEALSNVARHARASRVVVTLSSLDDRVLLDVRDDGCGFDVRRDVGNGGFGLTSMQQRLDGVGGTLTIESRPGGGTAICATVPLAASAKAEPSSIGAGRGR